MKAGQTNRRSFLQILGLSPFAANDAASEAANLMGISHTGRVLTSYNSFDSPTTDEFDPAFGNDLLQSNVRHYLEEVSKKLAIAQHFKRLLQNNTIPDYVHDELRRKASDIQRLDPDIANKRSWSWSVKMASQRERNYTRLVQSLHDDIHSYEKKVTFWKTHGFNFCI